MALSTMDSRKIKCLQEFTSHVPSDVDRKRALTEDKPPDDIPVLQKIVWRNVIFFIYTHLAALYGFYLMIFKAKGLTVLFAYLIASCSALGITAGAHRLWAHRSYKAKWQLRVILGIFQTIAFQNHIYEWSRDHRVHHKFSETDADPHNAKRGFFFSHMGWLLIKKHPDVRNKGKSVDMSDLEKDFVVVFQRRYYVILMPIMAFVLPTILPVYLWHEDPWIAWYLTVFKWIVSLHFTWLVNSAAHMWGNKPYDKHISPVENITVAILAYGEGFHNYHHVFPYDYKTAELGDYMFNPTTAFIDFCARIGWAYSLKTMSKETILKRVARTGDGTHKFSRRSKSIENADSVTNKNHDSNEDHLWGWGDKDMKVEDYKYVSVLGSEDVG